MNEKELQEQLQYHEQFLTEHKKNRIQSVLNERTRHITVALEDIYQPQNASAVLRTCDCFGVQEAHIIENRNEYNINPRVTHGSDKWVDVVKYKAKEENTLDCIQALKTKGYSIVVTTLNGWEHTLESVPIERKVAVMFGTEMEGITPEALEAADIRMKIPMVGFTQSFNISVSAAICLYSLTTRLKSSQIDWRLSQKEMDEIKLNWYRKVTNL